MPKDIRSFFTSAKPKSENGLKSASKEISSTKKRKALVISSDEDDEPQLKNDSKNKIQKIDTGKKPNNSNKISVQGKKEPNLAKLKETPVDISNIFGNQPVKRISKNPTSNATNASPKTPVQNANISELLDDDFDMSIVEVNDSLVDEEQTRKAGKSLKHEITNKSPMNGDHNLDVSIVEINDDDETPKPNKRMKHEKTDHKPKDDKNTSLNKTSDDNDYAKAVISDQERFERKMQSIALYHKFKKRGGATKPGSKEIPKGKPNCLSGLVFVVTGILESLERDDAKEIIEKYGGRVVTGISKKVTHMVVGDEAGPKKIAEAEDKNIPFLNEDDLLNLIRTKSGMPAKKTETPVKDKPEKDNVSPKKNKSPTKTPMKKEQSEKSNGEMKMKDVKQKSPEKIHRENIKIEKSAVRAPGVIKHDISPDLNIKREPDQYDKDIKSVENLAWVDKYKPTSTKQIIGQIGQDNNAVKLTKWLEQWHNNQKNRKNVQRPNPWAKNDYGSSFKAALLSGPPGVGKTTTAQLVCQELGLDAVEFNASDTRSKKLLKDEVADLLSNKSLYGYFHNAGEAISKKHVLIMDEVDGMAGNEDRGGIQELIALIKQSSVPIICMCNDRNHQKMRSLVNYCFDLKFAKPRLENIKSAMMTICFREKIKLPARIVDEIITASNNDIRQTINYLSMMSAKPLEFGTCASKKDFKLGPWEVVRKVFTASEHTNMTMNDKADLFFQDYSMSPLFVQENYLKVAPKVPSSEVLRRIALTADSLSFGDMIENKIRSKMNWSLLPMQAMFSSVLPGEYMSGEFKGQINFPGWLGKYSRTNKRNRLAQEIHDHTRIRTSASKISIRLDYAPILLNKILKPLRDKGSEGVAESLDVIKEYRLLREDIDSLVELVTLPGKKNGPMDGIEGKVKAALTRAYNKEIAPYTYSAVSAIKKKKTEAADDDPDNLYGDGENQPIVSDDEDVDNLDNDALIVGAKKKANSSKRNQKASTSRGKGKNAKGK